MKFILFGIFVITLFYIAITLEINYTIEESNIYLYKMKFRNFIKVYNNNPDRYRLHNYSVYMLGWKDVVYERDIVCKIVFNYIDSIKYTIWSSKIKKEYPKRVYDKYLHYNVYHNTGKGCCTYCIVNNIMSSDQSKK